MTNRLVRQLAVFLFFLPVCGYSRVATIEVSTLIKTSTMIMVGRVIDVTTDKGARIAHVKVQTIYKGKKLKSVDVLAQRTWVCDISDAAKGEVALFFLHSGTQDRTVFIISDNGRGKMPLRMIDGQQYVTLWADDVRVPTQIRSVAGPNHDQRWARSVQLSDLVALIHQTLSASR